jgi:hypothetical protein
MPILNISSVVELLTGSGKIISDTDSSYKLIKFTISQQKAFKIKKIPSFKNISPKIF